MVKANRTNSGDRRIGRRAAALAGAAALSLAVPAVAAGPAAAQAAPCVQKIAVVNNAAFVLSWSASTRTGERSATTDAYPINQTRTIDLAATAFPEGTDVRPYVHAVAGTDNYGNSYVSYCDNGQTATYTVTGTTLDYSVTLLT
ncbi:hypothetical protein Sru01_14040 [Sphaerisporangium rufum]|uniref:Fibronectin type III domain-containing protein n=1 Tax=Sphaerisporangium rufum TaxID=1381558 RepID=A0A919UZL1_9ACTN|nr:hypothetical protein [Sphaerisporangium rufum]GII76422.1 hypothetical protein Sru01_14040 [Sphaerisporangium rufum]